MACEGAAHDGFCEEVAIVYRSDCRFVVFKGGFWLVYMKQKIES